ncbi:unnamed protein product [Schistosoma margrebowiei]|uniref:Uncharacterized protein n=1 Tax=Schistosoma margrebowiei TaxID=48269 RepID=A0AA85ALB2_9TREM|nr:unnamed protein product [Schistosoma margrebowiei]
MITHNLIIYSIITIWILTVHYVNCAGILWGDHSTDTTKTYIRTTTKASRPVTEKQGPYYPRRQPKLICTQRGGIIQCYSVNKGTAIQRFNGKGLLWSLLTLNFIYLMISRYW